MGFKVKSKKGKKPKPRIPLPQKPPKVEQPTITYRRRKKHPAREDEMEENVDDSEFPENDSA